MIFKILGVVALVTAGLLALVCLLIVYTFFANLQASLLILLAIAAVFAWGFFAIGWQLVRPPGRAGRSADGRDGAAES
jgi:hypothetical protein